LFEAVTTGGLEGLMKIAVFGLGYVGTTVSACLAHGGNEVVGIDPSEDKVNAVNSGRSPIVEPGLNEMIQAGREKELLSATNDAGRHIESCSVAIVCVGTPSSWDGSHNLSSIVEVSRQIAQLLKAGRRERLTIAYRSTIRPGTIDEIIHPIFKEVAEDRSDLYEIVYNPEFLRESVAIDDYFHPAKIVIGTKDGGPCQNLDRLHAGFDAPVYYSRYREAEISKFVDNTFHAVKITFANEVGRLCSRLGIDARKVHEMFIADTKLNISPYYLRPGGAFGGSCLPKDVRALQHIGGDTGANAHLIDSLLRSNEAHKHFLFDLAAKDLKPGSKVLLIGISFKANTDDLRESPNVDLARKLIQGGYALSVYDPDVDSVKLVGQNLGYIASNLPALRRLLVTKEQVESQTYDLVIDTRGWAKKFSLNGTRVLNVNAL
jgi:GDP-mannose 6-dehydrogenase